MNFLKLYQIRCSVWWTYITPSFQNLFEHVVGVWVERKILSIPIKNVGMLTSFLLWSFYSWLWVQPVQGCYICSGAELYKFWNSSRVMWLSLPSEVLRPRRIIWTTGIWQHFLEIILWLHMSQNARRVNFILDTRYNKLNTDIRMYMQKTSYLLIEISTITEQNKRCRPTYSV